MPSKLLITGGSGFIGKALIRHLQEKRPEIRIFNLSPSHVEGTEHVRVDRNERFDFSALPSDFDYVVHALALSSDRYCEDFDLTEKINVGFTKDVLQFCARQEGLKKFVHFSSIVVYDNRNEPPVKETDPLAPYYGNYSFTKGLAEEYVRYFSERFKFPALTLRFSNVYGPGQTFVNSPFLIPEKIVQGLTEGKIVAQTPVPVRDFLYIDDAVEAVDAITFSPHAGIFNVAGGEGVSVEKIVEEIARQLDVPFSFGWGEARGPVRFYADISEISETVGWGLKTSLRHGIGRTIDFIKWRLS